MSMPLVDVEYLRNNTRYTHVCYRPRIVICGLVNLPLLMTLI